MLGLGNWKRQRILRNATLTQASWQRLVTELDLLQGLTAAELGRLRELVILFLHEKTFSGKHGLELDPAMRLTISAQACLPILNLGLDYYSGWSSLIIYPEAFAAPQHWRDQAGVVHHSHRPIAGEAWERGPVVLSWHDVLTRGDGFNVIIHEFAHKLDMLNGDLNGFPPLHKDMDAGLWAQVFNVAYERFCEQVEQGSVVWLDPYAAESPGEFFAVLSETFFELPGLLRTELPHLYRQLRAFYRQDPAARLSLRMPPNSGVQHVNFNFKTTRDH